MQSHPQKEMFRNTISFCAAPACWCGGAKGAMHANAKLHLLVLGSEKSMHAHAKLHLLVLGSERSMHAHADRIHGKTLAEYISLILIMDHTTTDNKKRIVHIATTGRWQHMCSTKSTGATNTRRVQETTRRERPQTRERQKHRKISKIHQHVPAQRTTIFRRPKEHHAKLHS